MRISFHRKVSPVSNYKERFSSLNANTLRQLSSRESTHVDTPENMRWKFTRGHFLIFGACARVNFLKDHAKAPGANENLRRAAVHKFNARIRRFMDTAKHRIIPHQQSSKRPAAHFFCFSPQPQIKRALKINK